MHFRHLRYSLKLLWDLEKKVLPISFSSEPGAFHGKSAYKKENETHAYGGASSSASTVAGNNPSWRPPSYRY